MNNQDKLQKFSIRKYAIGTFSTVIATLVFIGFNSGQAHASELNQPSSFVKKPSLNEDDEDSTVRQQISTEIKQTKNDVNTISENNTQLSSNEQATNSISDETQESIEEDAKNSLTNYPNKKNSLEVKTQSIKSSKDDKEKQKDSITEKSIINKRTTKENSNDKQVKDTDKPKRVQPPLDKTKLQALFDASYHDYRMIDTDKANTSEYNRVKATFDKVNDFLGNSENPESKQLALMYQELEQAIHLARTMPQRTLAKSNVKRSRRSANMDRSVGTDRARSPFFTANTEHYVSNENDGSSYPTGTFFHASNRHSPYNLPRSRRILKAADVRNMAYITTKRVKDGYDWDVVFNLGHTNHEYMIYWFGGPRDQTPVGPVTFTVINRDGTSTSSGGVGAGSGAPLNKFWETAGNINPSVAREFKHGSASNYPFYNNQSIHVNNFSDFARGGPLYFDRTGASSTAQYYGDQNFEMLNGQQLDQIQGLDSIYSFMGRGDVSYRISFKTTGLPTGRLYYAAGARALEYKQISNYNQLYVEPIREYRERIKSAVAVKNRTLHLGNTIRAYDPTIGRYTNRLVLDSDGNHSTDFADDPLSYVKNISESVMGFMPSNAPYNIKRNQGVNTLLANQIHEIFSQSNLEEAARTGKPIPLMIGFDAYDDYKNPETLKPVQLTVKPALQQHVKLWHNNEGRSMDTYSESKATGHAVYSVMAGNIYNNSPAQQDIRIQLTSNEPINDSDWSVFGYPNTLRLEDANGRTNNDREKNFALVGTLEPGNYFITVRLGNKEQQFEVRAKPSPPHIASTSTQIHSQNTRRPIINVTNVTTETNAKVLLVTGGQNGETDSFSDPYSKPSGYTIIARAEANEDGNVTINPSDYLKDLPTTGTVKAITYFNDTVQSNFSNEVNLISDLEPPSFGNVSGLKEKYYRGDSVNISIPLTENQGGYGINQVNVENLPSGWTSHLTKSSDSLTGTLNISGNITNAQQLNTVIPLRLIASDKAGNVSSGSQVKVVNINVSSLAHDFPFSPLPNGDRIVVVNPTQISESEKNLGKEKILRVNTSKTNLLATSNSLVPQSNGNILVNYKDGSQGTINEGNIFTYNPVRKDIYADSDVTDPKVATIFVPKGSRYEIGSDLRKYFSLSNGQDIPTNTNFTVMYANDTLPNSDQISHFRDDVHSYNITAVNAYNKASTNLTLRIKAVDVVAPSGDLRVYRLNPSTLSDKELNEVKQAFIEANRKLGIQSSDITINNPISGGASTVNVVVRKDRYNKTFTSHPGNMNFLRWTNIRDNYNISWTNDKLPNRDTDGGLSWSPDHKSIIYRYDATKGTPINLNQLLPLLKATTNVPNLRNNITGNEKELAIVGGTPSHKDSGYSTKVDKLANLRYYTKDNEIIQVLDLVQSSTGTENAEVSHSNSSYNERNSQVTTGEVPAANDAQAFQLDKVIKANGSGNGVMGAVYKAQLFLTPYGAKQYIDIITDTTDYTANLMDVTDNVINVYFVPSDSVKPSVSFGDYSNRMVFSGETFRNSMTVSDNFGVQSVTVPSDSGIAVTKNNSNNEVSGTAPNVTTETTKAVKVTVTDKSNNTTSQTFNVLIKPLKEKYRVTSNSTDLNPIRLSNVQNGARLSQSERQAVLNSLTITKISPNRNYVNEPRNEIRTKEISNVFRSNNVSTVTATVTYNDGSTSQISVLVRQTIPEVLPEPRYTVQGQNFPQGKGTNPKDFFKLRNGSQLNAQVTWVNNNGPNVNNSQIGVDIPLHAEILFEVETTPIRKDTTYKIVKSVPKQVFETTVNGRFANSGSAGSYIEPINRYWPNGMNFRWADGTNAPSSVTPGAFTKVATAVYSNGQTEDIKFYLRLNQINLKLILIAYFLKVV